MRLSPIFRFASLALLALILVRPGQAGADLITQAHSFSATPPTNFDKMIGITPFDSSLGTLDEVRVSIEGQMVVDIFAPTLWGFYGNPLPYDFTVMVEQEFFGLAGQFFTFGSPAEFLFARTHYGTGHGYHIVTPFTYDFSFDWTTDLIGFSTAAFTGALTPPVSVSGLRSDFLEPIVPVNEIDLVQSLSLVSAPVKLSLTFMSEGSMFIDYDYTPAPEPIPEPVPEPATMLLLGSGLAGLAAFRRRFRK